jgi:hypothetical protein
MSTDEPPSRPDFRAPGLKPGNKIVHRQFLPLAGPAILYLDDPFAYPFGTDQDLQRKSQEIGVLEFESRPLFPIV